MTNFNHTFYFQMFCLVLPKTACSYDSFTVLCSWPFVYLKTQVRNRCPWNTAWVTTTGLTLARRLGRGSSQVSSDF